MCVYTRTWGRWLGELARGCGCLDALSSPAWVLRSRDGRASVWVWSFHESQWCRSQPYPKSQVPRTEELWVLVFLEDMCPGSRVAMLYLLCLVEWWRSSWVRCCWLICTYETEIHLFYSVEWEFVPETPRAYPQVTFNQLCGQPWAQSG